MIHVLRVVPADNQMPLRIHVGIFFDRSLLNLIQRIELARRQLELQRIAHIDDRTPGNVRGRVHAQPYLLVDESYSGIWMDHIENYSVFASADKQPAVLPGASHPMLRVYAGATFYYSSSGSNHSCALSLALSACSGLIFFNTAASADIKAPRSSA
jgi:hypothetical protein